MPAVVAVDEDPLADALRDLPEVEGPNAVMAHLKGELGGSTDSSD